jgi:hypothetical protein
MNIITQADSRFYSRTLRILIGLVGLTLLSIALSHWRGGRSVNLSWFFTSTVVAVPLLLILEGRHLSDRRISRARFWMDVVIGVGVFLVYAAIGGLTL